MKVRFEHTDKNISITDLYMKSIEKEMMPPMRIELMTPSLQDWCSASEL